MGKLARVAIGSFLACAIGLVVGLRASGAYARRLYPNDPDPVDFNIAIVWLAVWLVVWVSGTALSAIIVRRKSSRGAA